MAALPAPQELFVEALFAIGAHVTTTPDTTPGVDPVQSVAICGVVIESEPSVDGWSYRVRADDSRRNIIWVPEARVRAVSKAVSENPMLETRAFPLQQQLKSEQHKSATLRVNNKALRLEYSVLAREISPFNLRMSVYLYASATSSCVDFIV
jgi:hypothetical protein